VAANPIEISLKRFPNLTIAPYVTADDEVRALLMKRKNCAGSGDARHRPHHD
jgi:hypothetical protein